MADLNLSVQKATALLRLIGQARDGCTLTELRERSGLALTVCHRLLATLEFEGLIESKGLRWPRKMTIFQDGKVYFTLTIDQFSVTLA